jgi:hypothetical protein
MQGAVYCRCTTPKYVIDHAELCPHISLKQCPAQPIEQIHILIPFVVFASNWSAESTHLYQVPGDLKAGAFALEEFIGVWVDTPGLPG